MGRIIVELLSPQGTNTERRFIFEDGKATIGRSYSNDIILDDPFVSSEHFSIENTGEDFFVVDLSSENGTELSHNVFLKGQGAKIRSGEEICIGKTRLRILLADHPVEPAKPKETFAAVRQFLDKSSVAISSSLFAMGMLVWFIKMDTPEAAFETKEFFIYSLVYIVFALLYSSFFRIFVSSKQFKTYFKRFLTIINLDVFFEVVFTVVDPFLYFWIMDNRLMIFFDGFVSLLFSVAMFWVGLKLTKDVLRMGDYIKIAVISIALASMAVVASDGFSWGSGRKPIYPAKMVPYLQPLTKPQKLDTFLEESGRELFSAKK